MKWRQDSNQIDSETACWTSKCRWRLIRVHRVRGHLIADLTPAVAGTGNANRTRSRYIRFDYLGLGARISPAEWVVSQINARRFTGNLRDVGCRSIGISTCIFRTPMSKGGYKSVWKVRRNDRSSINGGCLNDQRGRVSSASATKYVGTKRFGLEGAESAIPILDVVLELTADTKMHGAVLGMAHRGRLNVLANVMGKSYDQIFQEFEGHIDPSSVQGSGDVKYHLGVVGTYVSRSGAELPIELSANPSHLEAVNPIVLGTVRAAQDHIDPPLSYSVLPVLVHGDASFAGQGIVAECLAMSDTSGYRVGGTIHLIINNQIGFTTSPQYARSSHYCSDVAKTVQAPIFHVNGDDPRRVCAWRDWPDYRQRFHKDVVIDMLCIAVMDTTKVTTPVTPSHLCTRRSRAT